MSSPTQRSIAHLKKKYPLVRIVEHWNSFARLRIDLWGFDIMAVGGGEVVLVQTTTGSNVSARITKITEDKFNVLPHLRAANVRLLVHGWRKVGARGKRKLWDLREVDIS